MKRILLMCFLLVGITSVSYAQTPKPTTTDPAEKAKSLQKELKLTDGQTAKITTIYQESAQKFDKIKKDANGNTNKMLVAIRPLRVATIKKIKNVLTPAQGAKYDKLIKDTKPGGGNGWSDGWSATAQN
jgi:periplasmic protein CpxP/Spy